MTLVVMEVNCVPYVDDNCAVHGSSSIASESVVCEGDQLQANRRAQIILCFMLYIIHTCMLYYSFNGDGLCTMAACSMKCKVENCTRLLANRCIPDAGLVYVPILYNHKLHYLYSIYIM